MKISAVINKPTFTTDIKKKSVLLCALIIFSGIIAGIIIFIFFEDDVSSELHEKFLAFFSGFCNKNESEIFSGLVTQNLILFAVMMIFSLSVFGTPAVILTSFTKALGLGLLTSYIYNAYALKGIEYCLLVFFPGKIILLFAMLLMTQSSYMMSDSIRKCVLSNRENRGVEFSGFIMRSLLILFITVLASAVDFAAICCFSSLFSFS